MPPTYRAPVEDVAFLLRDLLDYDGTIATLPGFEDADLETVLEVLAAGGQFCSDVLAPLNGPADREGCHLEEGRVRTPAGFREAYAAFVDGGWAGLGADPAHGGAGLPQVASTAFGEFLAGANLSFSTYPELTHGAALLLARHGSDDQRARWLPALSSGSMSGTMCLTEAHAGTDLGLVRTRAEPDPSGGYRVSGTKIFITAGEHDLTENILHLVLARLPDAPAGTRGISLLAVPKLLPDGSPNGVVCGSLEHKLGIRASATCVLHYEGARAELVGEAHRGMPIMFTMMNGARLGVGVEGLGVGEAARQIAVAYARERLQGRSLAGPARPDLEADPIVVHPDVRLNLLRMRALTEAGRALALWVARELDVAARHPDGARRQEASDVVALMTPVVKAALTDHGVLCANLALQVHGGHGYIVETGVEQLVRDARITQVYEGTNGVQALDLVGRKLPDGAGRMLRRLCHPTAAWVEEHRRHPELGELAEPLGAALGRLQRTTLWLGGRALADREEAGAAATEYLRLLALTTFGYLWARMAEVALDTSSGTPEALRRSKLELARFYMARVLPETSALARQITAGKATVMRLEAELL
jgi:alkylation response protein AidB-like acyl-CoA dehydrogenase